MKQTSKHTSSSKKILSQTEVDEGTNRVIITEYENGARSFRTIRPPRPFYQRIWFYTLILGVLFGLFAILGN